MRKVEGLILTKYFSSEADEVVVALTKQRGKMYFRARGVKKAGAKHAGGLRELTHLTIFFVEGRSLPIIIDTQPHHTFVGVRDSLEGLRAARAVARIVEETTAREGRDDALWGDVIDYLTAINIRTSGPIPLPLAPIFFMYKLLMHHGMQPVLERCTVCGNQHQSHSASFFSAPSGGLLCEQCVYADPTALAISHETLATLIRWRQIHMQDFLSLPGQMRQTQAEIIKTVEHFGRWHLGTPITLQAR